MRLPPQTTLFLAVLFASGCAHSAPMQEAPPTVAVTTAGAEPQNAADTPTPPVEDSTSDSGTAPAESFADDDDAVPPSTDTSRRPGDIALQPTEAELDYAAIYGEPEYNPIADPSLPAAAIQPTSYDPLEKFNRRVHRFNNVVDRNVAKPLATTYVKVVPRPVRLGVSNFFNNLGQPVSAVNALLQGKPKQAGQSLGRFLLNTTLGIAGVFDPATSANIPNKSEDFGQTLGVWGWKRSRYVELPLFGPRTIRDSLGMAGDAPLSPLRQVEEDNVRVFLQGLQLVDVRTQLLSVDRLREGAADDYALVRDAWIQRRNYQIFGESKENSDDDLPEYLQNVDDNPMVPINAMPVLPGAP